MRAVAILDACEPIGTVPLDLAHYRIVVDRLAARRNDEALPSLRGDREQGRPRHRGRHDSERDSPRQRDRHQRVRTARERHRLDHHPIGMVLGDRAGEPGCLFVCTARPIDCLAIGQRLRDRNAGDERAVNARRDRPPHRRQPCVDAERYCHVHPDHDNDNDNDIDLDPDRDPDIDIDLDNDPDHDHDPDLDPDPDRDHDPDLDPDPDRDHDPDLDPDHDHDPDPDPRQIADCAAISSPARAVTCSSSCWRSISTSSASGLGSDRNSANSSESRDMIIPTATTTTTATATTTATPTATPTSTSTSTSTTTTTTTTTSISTPTATLTSTSTSTTTPTTTPISTPIPTATTTPISTPTTIPTPTPGRSPTARRSRRPRARSLVARRQRVPPRHLDRAARDDHSVADELALCVRSVAHAGSHASLVRDPTALIERDLVHREPSDPSQPDAEVRVHEEARADDKTFGMFFFLGHDGHSRDSRSIA